MNKNIKYYVGITFLIIAVVLDVAFVFVPFCGFKSVQIVSLMTVLAIAAECSFILSILLLGKEILIKIKEKLKSFLKTTVSQPQIISKRRHTIGIWLFFMSFLSYPIIEIALLFGSPAPGEHLIFFFILLCGDLAFLISLFVLGESFWEKLKDLVSYNKNPIEKK